jgi:hypothetical protein
MLPPCFPPTSRAPGARAERGRVAGIAFQVIRPLKAYSIGIPTRHARARIVTIRFRAERNRRRDGRQSDARRYRTPRVLLPSSAPARYTLSYRTAVALILFRVKSVFFKNVFYYLSLRTCARARRCSRDKKNTTHALGGNHRRNLEIY